MWLQIENNYTSHNTNSSANYALEWFSIPENHIYHLQFHEGMKITKDESRTDVHFIGKVHHAEQYAFQNISVCGQKSGY